MGAINAVHGFVASIGATVLGLCAAAGRLTIFTVQAVLHIFRPPWYWRELGRQFLMVGYFSLPVVGLTALFTGGALALQIYLGGARFNAESVVPSIVAIGMVRELGPVIGALMVAGRVSAAIAAELGTMKVTEQIDALSTLSTNPMKYLVAPRLLAATISLPLLVLVSDIIGVLGGYMVGIGKLEFNSGVYLQTTIDFLTLDDVTSGLVKAAVFGFIISLMGCYHGFNSERGAQGVGRATTNAVVSASILIFAANYLLTDLLFSV